jgi:hypothetical protein
MIGGPPPKKVEGLAEAEERQWEEGIREGSPTAQPFRGQYHGERYRADGEDAYRVPNAKGIIRHLKCTQPNEFR